MNRVQTIKKELKDVDNYNAIEHGKSVSQLYEVTKDDKITLFDYETYKQNPKDCDEKIKKHISDYKYDVILAAKLSDELHILMSSETVVL